MYFLPTYFQSQQAKRTEHNHLCSLLASKLFALCIIEDWPHTTELLVTAAHGMPTLVRGPTAIHASFPELKALKFSAIVSQTSTKVMRAIIVLAGWRCPGSAQWPLQAHILFTAMRGSAQYKTVRPIRMKLSGLGVIFLTLCLCTCVAQKYQLCCSPDRSSVYGKPTLPGSLYGQTILLSPCVQTSFPPGIPSEASVLNNCGKSRPALLPSHSLLASYWCFVWRTYDSTMLITYEGLTSCLHNWLACSMMCHTTLRAGSP
ncbi:hypothetical protein CEXT_144111 [Caerostris extrusa]|uniref:Uncharacterized protein n=1 Tax=Caerostris extrusa TaxID=172846 RepID=A0AAV4NTU7_CAEEX|nr:hypothetical protein CEXT_144111 [Caerostris extrusa]